MACLRAQRNFHNEMIMRELNQKELNVIVGDDRKDYAQLGMGIGKTIGAFLGFSGGPYVSQYLARRGGAAGLALGGTIYDILKQK